MTSHQRALIDSHIHLYTRSHLSTLRWASSLPSGHVLKQQNSVTEYRNAIFPSAENLRGFIFVESDRISSLSEDGWNHALDEVGFLVSIAKGKPRDEKNEGFRAADRGLVLGIVPWAPLPAGSDVMERYMSLVKERCEDEEVWTKISGVRYLVQDKPSGVMLQPAFIESLKWLGKRGLTFDLGVDARSAGIWQLREACEMLRLVYNSDDTIAGGRELNCKLKPKVVINHLCKPNLQLSPDEIAEGHTEYMRWKKCIEEMASSGGTFMKLSGGFSELPPSQNWEDPGSLESVVKMLQPWIDVVFDAFGPSRIMFGSDWPVCNVGGPGVELSWQYWHDIVAALISARNLSDYEISMVWSGTAQLAYNIH